MDPITFYSAGLLCTGVALVVLVFWYRTLSRPKPDRVLTDTFKIHGAPLSKRELAEAMRGNFAELGFDSQVRQPKVLSESERCLHVLNLGPTGVGKTSYFTSTLLWRDIARPDNALVIFDSQLDLIGPVLTLAAAARRSVLIYPDAGFNPLRGPGSAAERAAAFADLLAQVPELTPSGPGDFYSDQQQLWVRKVVPLYERVEGQPMILRELLGLAVSPDWRDRLFERAGACPELADYVLHFGSWKESDYTRTLSSLVGFIDRLTSGERAWLYNQRTAPTLEEAIDAKQIILIREGGYRREHDRTLGLLFMIALQGYVRRRDLARSPHFVGVYLDEAHLYFNHNFPAFIATARKKRVSLNLGFQSLAQFGDYADIITTNARTWLVHSGLLAEDAAYIADNIGQRQFTDISVGQAPTNPHDRPQQNASLKRDYLMPPERIRGLSQDQVLVLSVQDREIDAARVLLKPPLLSVTSTPYVPAVHPPYAPPTIWEARAVHQATYPHPHTPSARLDVLAPDGTAAGLPDNVVPLESRRVRHQHRVPQVFPKFPDAEHPDGSDHTPLADRDPFHVPD